MTEQDYINKIEGLENHIKELNLIIEGWEKALNKKDDILNDYQELINKLRKDYYKSTLND